jgi:hypothetical protein
VAVGVEGDGYQWLHEGVKVDWQKLLPPQGFVVLPRRWVVERSFAWTSSLGRGGNKRITSPSLRSNVQLRAADLPGIPVTPECRFLRKHLVKLFGK